MHSDYAAIDAASIKHSVSLFTKLALTSLLLLHCTHSKMSLVLYEFLYLRTVPMVLILFAHH